MLKRIFSISLVLIYSTIISGFTLNLHYCGGSISSIGLSLTDAQKTCECGDKAMKKSCCESKSAPFQFKTNQELQGSTILNILNPVKDLFPISFINLNLFTPDFPEVLMANVSHSPPKLASSNPIYLLNRVFLI